MSESVYKTKIDMLEHDLRNVKIEVKELDVRLRMNENKADVTASKLDSIIDIVKRINNKIDDFAKTPARRWEMLVGIVISVIITAIATYILKG